MFSAIFVLWLGIFQKVSFQQTNKHFSFFCCPHCVYTTAARGVGPTMFFVISLWLAHLLSGNKLLLFRPSDVGMVGPFLTVLCNSI